MSPPEPPKNPVDLVLASDCNIRHQLIEHRITKLESLNVASIIASAVTMLGLVLYIIGIIK